jgi:hypothetical protein
MVSPRLPKHIAAAHAFEAAKNILYGIVQRMAHVQRTRNIGRRNNDGVGLGLGLATGLKISTLLPRFVQTGFNFGRVEFCFKRHDQSQIIGMCLRYSD